MSVNVFRPLAGFLLVAALAPAAQARVEITLDAATLNEFLTAVTPPSMNVALPSGGSLRLDLRDLRVKGFDPAAGANGRGHVLTSMRVGIPDLGLELPLEPRLSLDVTEENGEKVCILKFERVDLPLPLGSLNIGSLLQPYRVPAEGAWTLTLKQGDVHVKSRLVDTRMGTEGLRLGFVVEMAPEKAPKKQGS